MRNPRLRSKLICVIAVFLALAAIYRTVMAEQALPAEAQRALERGLAAAQQSQWDVGIRYFREAFKRAPSAPVIMFNLGLAHARAGHEQSAMAWLHAYLAAAPQAPNVLAVRREIDRLNVGAEAKVDRIFREAMAAASQLTGDKRLVGLSHIGVGKTAAGDVEGAGRIREEIRGSLVDRVFDLEASANGIQLARTLGDLRLGMTIISKVSVASHQDGLWRDLRAGGAGWFHSADEVAVKSLREFEESAGKICDKWSAVSTAPCRPLVDGEIARRAESRVDPVSLWSDLAQSLTFGYRLGTAKGDNLEADLESVLKQAAAQTDAADIPWRLSEIGAALGRGLFSIHAFERRLRFSAGGRTP